MSGLNISKLEVAEALIERGENKIDATGYATIPIILPDWEIGSHFTLERGATKGTATVWANRNIIVPRLNEFGDNNWSIVRAGLLRYSGDISRQIRSFFNAEHDDINTEAVNVPSLNTGDYDLHRLQIEKTTIETMDRPRITKGFLGGLVTTDLLLANFGVEVSPTVNLDVVSHLISEPSLA